MHWMILWCVEEIKKLKKALSDLSFTTDSRITRMQSSIGDISITGTIQVYTNAGDPNGVVSVPHTYPSICIDTSNNIIWTKTDGAISNTGWGSP